MLIMLTYSTASKREVDRTCLFQACHFRSQAVSQLKMLEGSRLPLAKSTANHMVHNGKTQPSCNSLNRDP